MKSNSELCAMALAAIQKHISSDNLRYAFIAGSRASDEPRQCSDIDFFLLLNRPSVEDETAVADAMRSLHSAHDLEFDHCGEILSLATLNSLLAGSANLRTLTERGFLETACFQTDCVLSIARKTLVVLHMLASPKVLTVGNLAALYVHESCAKAYFDGSPKFSPPLRILDLVWPDGDGVAEGPERVWRVMMDRINAGELYDTPLGISLERWFSGREFVSAELPPEISPPPASLLAPPDCCPLLSIAINHPLTDMMQMQCLGYKAAF